MSKKNYDYYSRMDEQSLRKAYSQARRTAMKRLQRMGESEFRTSHTYRENVNRFRPLKELTDKDDLVQAMVDVSGFVGRKDTTIRGMASKKKKSLATLHRNEYDFVTEENYQDFVDFIEWYKDMYGGDIAGSPTDEELTSYLDALSRGVSPDRAKQLFDDYMTEGGEGPFEDYLEAEKKVDERKKQKKQRDYKKEKKAAKTARESRKKNRPRKK